MHKNFTILIYPSCIFLSIPSPSTLVEQSTLIEQEKKSSLYLHFSHPPLLPLFFHWGETQPRVFHDNNVKLDLYTYRLSCLTFRDPSRVRRGPPLQVLEEKIRYSGSISNGAIPLVDCRTWQWTDYTIGHRVATALLDEPVSARRISPTRGHRDDGCTGASSAFVFPHLGPTATVAGGVRWNIHDSRIVSERVLNRTKLFARAFFSRESDASNFEIFKGVAIFSFSCFVSLWILSCNLQLINERYSIVFKFFNGNGENSFILKERGNYSEYFKLSSKTGTICF